jgi:hypothetical protein
MQEKFSSPFPGRGKPVGHRRWQRLHRELDKTCFLQPFSAVKAMLTQKRALNSGFCRVLSFFLHNPIDISEKDAIVTDHDRRNRAGP